jgi:hypothetical protein
MAMCLPPGRAGPNSIKSESLPLTPNRSMGAAHRSCKEHVLSPKHRHFQIIPHYRAVGRMAAITSAPTTWDEAELSGLRGEYPDLATLTTDAVTKFNPTPGALLQNHALRGWAC